jgi:hypothetical protein
VQSESVDRDSAGPNPGLYSAVPSESLPEATNSGNGGAGACGAAFKVEIASKQVEFPGPRSSLTAAHPREGEEKCLLRGGKEASGAVKKVV